MPAVGSCAGLHVFGWGRLWMKNNDRFNSGESGQGLEVACWVAEKSADSDKAQYDLAGDKNGSRTKTRRLRMIRLLSASKIIAVIKAGIAAETS
jgi:hypothetical protein